MKLATLLALPVSLIAAVVAEALPSHQPEYSEHLHLKPLPGGSLYAGFNFTSLTSLAAYEQQHFRYFPRSVAQILQHSHTAELHLRFALGRWDDSWGSRPRHGRREGGTGVELWAWVDDDATADSEENWNTLVNSLSGLFCASLNFIDESKSTQPVLSFRAEGVHGDRLDDLVLKHGTLPHEVVCTENLTPFLKLLPCKGKTGISSLLDGHKVFDANWQTMSIDVRHICDAPGKRENCLVEIQQTIDMVLDVERSMRPTDDPIPRPPPIESITCDISKPYNAPDTCYPKLREGEIAWSLSKVFGSPLQGSCHLDDSAAPQTSDVTLEVPPSRSVEVLANSPIDQHSDNDHIRHYRLPESSSFDLSLPSETIPDSPLLNSGPLTASRQITGYVQERGGMHATIQNLSPHSQTIIYFESLPWFLRPFVHTLRVDGATLQKMYYTPSLDRARGSRLELLLHVPAHSTVDITYDFEKAILRYTEYPPDANRGFDVAPAVIRVLPSAEDADGQGSYLRTTSLLLPLPTPDFSMPYNVIILTSTVIALGFGSIFNLLVRRFALVEEVPPSPVAVKIKMVAARARGLVQAVRGGSSVGEKSVDGSTAAARSKEPLQNGAAKAASREETRSI